MSIHRAWIVPLALLLPAGRGRAGDAAIETAVRSARTAVETRRAALKAAAGAGITCDEDGSTLAFSVPPSLLENPGGRFSFLRDAAASLPAASAEAAYDPSEDFPGRKFAAVRLAQILVEAGALSPEEVAVRPRPGTGETILLTMSSLPPAGAAEGPRAALRTLPPREEGGASFETSFLPAGDRGEWSLDILDGKRVIKSLAGRGVPPRVLSWNGKEAGRRSPPSNAYKAVLLMKDAAGEETASDQTAFTLGGPPAPAGRGEPLSHKKWFRLIRFPEGGDALKGPAHLAVEQTAQTMILYPEKSIVIEGYADAREPGAPSLAERRANVLADALVRAHGVSAERVSTRSRVLTGPGNDFGQKAVLYFLD